MIPRPARLVHYPPRPTSHSSLFCAAYNAIRRHAKPLSTSTSTASTASATRPLKLAIIGSGPSGFYTASRILQSVPLDSPAGQAVEVHMYERLPTPYGLVRYGVAPDHPEVKNCQHKFDELSLDPRFKFFGNVLVSSQPSSSSPSLSPTPTPPTALSPYTYPHALRLSLRDIMPYYTHLILTYGASLSNPLSGVAGSSSSSSPQHQPLEGVFPALALVSWYNSHPAFSELGVNLENVREVTIVGQGNVALDVARILLKPADLLAQTDLSDHVLDTLARSKVQKVSVVGRRGPGQVAFTTKEFREMLHLPGVAYGGVEKGLMERAKEQAQAGGERMRKRLLGLMEKPSESAGPGSKEFELDFLKSPRNFLGERGKVNGVEWNINQLLSVAPQDPTPTPPPSQAPSVPSTTPTAPAAAVGTPVQAQTIARPTGQVVVTPADMVVESVGYRAEPLGSAAGPAEGEGGEGKGAWALPFDNARGRVRNVSGRVVDEQGVAIPGIYAAGWAARGPVGVIASTMHDAYALSSLILEDHYGSTSSPVPVASSSSAAGPGPLPTEPEQGIPAPLLDAKNKGKVVDLEGWKAIDRAEVERARTAGKGKEREKFRTVQEMLAVLG